MRFLLPFFPRSSAFPSWRADAQGALLSGDELGSLSWGRLGQGYAGRWAQRVGKDAWPYRPSYQGSSAYVTSHHVTLRRLID